MERAFQLQRPTRMYRLLHQAFDMHEPGANTVVYPPNAMNSCKRQLCVPTQYCTPRRLYRGRDSRPEWLSLEIEKKLHKRNWALTFIDSHPLASARDQQDNQWMWMETSAVDCMLLSRVPTQSLCGGVLDLCFVCLHCNANGFIWT